MHLHGPFADALRQEARAGSCSCDEVQGSGLASIDDARSLHGKRFRQFDIREDIDRAMLQGLEGAERAAELSARAHVGQRALEELGCAANRLGGQRDLQRQA